MSESNNVIIFPNSPIRDTIQTPEDVQEKIEMLHLYHIDESLEAIAHILFGNLDLAGFCICDNTEEDIKNRIFIIESIKSVLCSKYGIEHPFQDFKENIFLEDECYTIKNKNQSKETVNTISESL